MSDAACVCGHDAFTHGDNAGACNGAGKHISAALSFACPCLGFTAVRGVEYNPVTKPAHYSWIPGIECKDVVQHFNYYAGCAIKYLWRYQHKGNPIEDLKKSREYIDNEIARLEKERTK